MGCAEPMIWGRLKASVSEWEKLNPPEWILPLINDGLKIPFESLPRPIVLPNNKTAVEKENVQWVRETLQDYIHKGFVKKVDSPPKMILPLQVSVHSSRKKY